MAMGWWKPYFFLDPNGVQMGDNLPPNFFLMRKRPEDAQLIERSRKAHPRGTRRALESDHDELDGAAAGRRVPCDTWAVPRPCARTGRASCLPYVPEAQGSSGACWGRRVGTLHVEAACLWPSGKEQGPGVPGPDMDRIRTGGNA